MTPSIQKSIALYTQEFIDANFTNPIVQVIE